jgi:hypothetical protein
MAHHSRRQSSVLLTKFCARVQVSLENLRNERCKYYIRTIELRRVIWAGFVARMGEMGNAYKIVVGKTEGKSYFGDLRVYERIIKMDLKEIECEDMYWIHLAQDGVQRPAVVNTVVNPLVP